MNNAEKYYLTQSIRQYLLPAMKEVFGDICAMCKEQKLGYEIDHIKYTDKVTMYDLQLLCADCHKSKTMVSNEAWLTRTPHCATCRCYG